MKRVLILLSLFVASSAWAHRPSDSVLRLTVQGARVDGRWDIAIRDLDSALGLDADGDRNVTGAELRAAWERIDGYALPRLKLSSDGKPCQVRLDGHAFTTHSDGGYAVLLLAGTCERAPSVLGVDDSLLYDIDAQHRGLVTINGQTAILRADASHADFTVESPPFARELFGLIEEGVLHIWAGTDHILFLLALLLPSVLGYRERRPLVNILKVVTGFTVAHSITLALAGLGLVSLPSRFVETAIAVTVVIAAVNNLRADASARWPVAFCLGLLHGFGFANVLGDLGMSGQRLAVTLFGFNVGVELGQASIVLAFLPLAAALRKSALLRRGTLLVGSAAIAAIAFYWAIERAVA